MALLLHSGGLWLDIPRGSVKLRQGAQKTVDQIWIKHNDIWKPLWDDGVIVAKLGIAQFSDTDFTGGKTDPNQAGDPYDRWTGPQDFIDSQLLTKMEGPRSAGITFSLNIPFPEYGYFAHPASLGMARFLDLSSGYEGGWDGATWGDGGMGETSGPISVIYDDGTGPAEWLVYRTNYSGIGSMSWKATFYYS